MSQLIYDLHTFMVRRREDIVFSERSFEPGVKGFDIVIGLQCCNQQVEV